jgi:3,4-dihydroxy 2-butanone 4-phosphate synthase/GTP cyclohydrolase II
MLQFSGKTARNVLIEIGIALLCPTGITFVRIAPRLQRVEHFSTTLSPGALCIAKSILALYVRSAVANGERITLHCIACLDDTISTAELRQMTIASVQTRSYPNLSSIDEIVDDAKNGRMFILVDDEDRENEGDLVIPASMATDDAINFMARYARGLICLSLTKERVDKLGLALMSEKNSSPHKTAFTVSIEAREGVTTGISASDRARTIAVAIDPDKDRHDLVVPGHVFPLIAEDGGVLVRAGHTEAAVDVSRLAGLTPAGVICEIMNDDGSMARLPDLVKFAQLHGLKIATIADLISYRRRTEKLVHCVAESKFASRFGGDFIIRIYGQTVGKGEHIALIKGDLSIPDPVLVRMHQHHVLLDSLGEIPGSGSDGRFNSDLEGSMRIVGAAGRGVIVIIREPPPALSAQVKMRAEAKAPSKAPELRHYGWGAQILADLGIQRMILLSSNPQVIVGVEGYGLEICGRQAIE